VVEALHTPHPTNMTTMLLRSSLSIIIFLVLVSSTSGWSSPSRRRRVLESIVTSLVVVFPTSIAAANAAVETIGKEADCKNAGCLGVWDGLLADCPHGVMSRGAGAGCASSQDDMPGIFAEP
jgi:hypothetical protein